MSITDYEIMGGIGYGSDLLSGMDLRAEQAFPSALNTYEQYQPIKQEPMGRNYRPDQFKSSDYSYDYYKYPAFNENDPIYGIDFERDSYAKSNALAVENAFQTENARHGGQIDINRFAGKNQAANSYNRISQSGPVESLVGSAVEFCKDNNNITIMLIVMMFLIFVIVSYLQSCHINELQKMLKRVIKSKSIQ